MGATLACTRKSNPRLLLQRLDPGVAAGAHPESGGAVAAGRSQAPNSDYTRRCNGAMGATLLSTGPYPDTGADCSACSALLAMLWLVFFADGKGLVMDWLNSQGRRHPIWVVTITATLYALALAVPFLPAVELGWMVMAALGVPGILAILAGDAAGVAVRLCAGSEPQRLAAAATSQEPTWKAPSRAPPTTACAHVCCASANAIWHRIPTGCWQCWSICRATG